MKSVFFILPVLASALRFEQAPLTPAQDCLIELGDGSQRWIAEDEKWALRREGVRFFDITHTPDAPVTTMRTVKYPDEMSHNASIVPLFDNIDKTRMSEFLTTFSGFHTRYYKSDYGRQSSEWLYKQVNSSLAGVGSVRFFEHSWGQNSIIATIPGKTNKTVIVSAHQDSINLWLPSVLAAPGADDDGSGTTVILEALRVIMNDKKVIKGQAENTIEFHFFSAEEGGLLGSQAVFQAYSKAGRDVVAMLQQDMTGYTKGTLDAGLPESLGLITDFVDPSLTEFIRGVIHEYCDIPLVETKCGYACSDHASSTKYGYPSAFVIESSFELSNKNIHSTADTFSLLDLDHMVQHTKLTTAFVLELAFAKL